MTPAGPSRTSRIRRWGQTASLDSVCHCPGARACRPPEVAQDTTASGLRPALMMGKAQAWVPGPEADLPGVALQRGSFSAPTPALLPDHWTHWAAAQIPPTQAQLHSGPARMPALGVSMEGPREPSPRPGVSRQHPQSAWERGPVRAPPPPTHLTAQQEPPLRGAAREDSVLCPGPSPQATVEAPCHPAEPTERQYRGELPWPCSWMASRSNPATLRRVD